MRNDHSYRFVPASGYLFLVVCLLLLSGGTGSLMAQDEEVAAAMEEAVIHLTFSHTDTTRICTALVTSGGKPVPEKEVHFYIKRMYSLLPVGNAVETDTTGTSVMEFPLDMPGDERGYYTVVSKIEDDDTFGTVEESAEVKWGVSPPGERIHTEYRSLSASRENAPAYLILVSNLIIAVIWGVLIYIVIQVFRIRKASRLVNIKRK